MTTTGTEGDMILKARADEVTIVDGKVRIEFDNADGGVFKVDLDPLNALSLARVLEQMVWQTGRKKK